MQPSEKRSAGMRTIVGWLIWVFAFLASIGALVLGYGRVVAELLLGIAQFAIALMAFGSGATRRAALWAALGVMFIVLALR